MFKKRVIVVRVLLLSLVLISIAGPVSLADSGDERKRLAGPDLAQAIMTLADLPESFEALTEQDLGESSELALSLATLLEEFTQAQVQYPAIFVYEDASQYEVLVNLFVSPLNRLEQAALDAVLSRPASAIQALEEYLGDLGDVIGIEPLPGTWALGDDCAALTAVMDAEPNPLRIEAVIMRRGPVVSILWDMRVRGTEPGVDIGRLSRIVDERVAEAVAAGRASYRPSGPLVPELTTYIPTPLDVSTEPKVVSANLQLAALATVLLAIIQEALNRVLAEHEDDIQRMLGRWPLLNRLVGRASDVPRPESRLAGLVQAIKLVTIVLFYGLVFSLLERGWDPFTVTGVYLFVCMTIASALVGLSDDIAQYRAARRWGVPAELDVRPGNLLLAVISTAASRVFSLVPGVMFGLPEAFEVDSSSLDEQRERKLLLAGLRTLVLVGATAWLLSGVAGLGSSLVSVASLAMSVTPNLAIGIGGLQSLLLLAFASAVQNTFLELLGLPGTVGQMLRQWNRWLWGLAMLGTSFLFYHTLLNPQGDLTAAMQTTNVRVFLITGVGFAVLAVAVWLYFKLLYREGSPPAAVEDDQ